MSRFLNEKYQKLAPYTPGEQPRDQQYVKLNTNESPYPPAPGVLEVLGSEGARLQLYPDPEAFETRKTMAALYGVDENEIVLTNGSDEALAFAFMALMNEKDGVRFPDITYGFYPVYAGLYGLPYTEVPLMEDFSINLEDYKNCGSAVVIANPNAPTGIAFRPEELETVIASNPDQLVIIDEAYVDFYGESCVPLIHKYDNLLVIQTFSKSRSLAGGRLGMAFGCRELISDLNRLRYSQNPYNINRLTLSTGRAALLDDAYFKACVEKIQTERKRTTETLSELGFTVLPSRANFVFAKPNFTDGGTLYRTLKEKGVLVRHFDKARIADYVRITIGTPEQMDVLFQKILEMKAEVK